MQKITTIAQVIIEIENLLFWYPLGCVRRPAHVCSFVLAYYANISGPFPAITNIFVQAKS